MINAGNSGHAVRLPWGADGVDSGKGAVKRDIVTQNGDRTE